MIISEIFHSIQGESTYAGLPCIFVRLTGCNLRCTWCDTAYAFHGGAQMSIEQVLGRVACLAGRPSAENISAATTADLPATSGPAASRPVASGPATPNAAASGAVTSLVELTGGEPLLQPETVPLAERLVAAGYTVLIETSGERWVGTLPRAVVKIVDVKCPDSGEGGTFRLDNLVELDGKDEVKFVISSRRDYEFARGFVQQHSLATRVRQALFSPVFADPRGTWPGLDPRILAEWVLADRLPVRLGLQLHKFIWDPAVRGV
jgi:7-carboxy-7-deazaguanine synthase